MNSKMESEVTTRKDRMKTLGITVDKMEGKAVINMDEMTRIPKKKKKNSSVSRITNKDLDGIATTTAETRTDGTRTITSPRKRG